MAFQNCRFGITRYLHVTWARACDHYAYHRGPGLVAIERAEKTWEATHPGCKQFGGILWWFEVATPHDIQDVLRPGGFLGVEADVKLIFGRGRKSLWCWAENDRRRWLLAAGHVPVDRWECDVFGIPSLGPDVS